MLFASIFSSRVCSAKSMSNVMSNVAALHSRREKPSKSMSMFDLQLVWLTAIQGFESAASDFQVLLLL